MSPFVHVAGDVPIGSYETDRIQPYVTNPRYWQYGGQPIMLFGGDHNTDGSNCPTNDPMGNPTKNPLGTEHYDQHLDLLVSAGGNYVRNGLAYRNTFSEYPFAEGTPFFQDNMTSTTPWAISGGSMALNSTWTLDETGSITLWGTANTMVLSRSITAVDITGGRVHVPFWVANTTTSGRVSSVRVRLKTGSNYAEVVYEGSMGTGWHQLIFPANEFSGSGFDATAVDGLELRVVTTNTVAQDTMGFDTVKIRAPFNLTQWNQVYWDDFAHFLEATHSRDIIVQMELWDKVDFFGYLDASTKRWHNRGAWRNYPYNPQNNSNYTAATSGLKEIIDYSYNPDNAVEDGDRGIATIHPFLWTPPSCAELLPGGSRPLADLELTSAQHQKLVDVVLPFQQALIDKMLSYTLSYTNVLYAINNESHFPTYDWMKYWSEYLRTKATAAGKNIEIGEMRGEIDASSAPSHAHAYVIQNPNLFDFIDISQNTAGSRTLDARYNSAIWVRDQLTTHGVRPMTSVKAYGGTTLGPPRFWVHLFAGTSTTRAHRRLGVALARAFDSNGLALSESNVLGLTTFEAVSMLSADMDLWRSAPANNLLTSRAAGEAYALAIAGEKYAVYFPAGGSVGLTVPSGNYSVRWLNIPNGTWSSPTTHTGVTSITLTPTVNPNDIAVVTQTAPA